MKTRFAFRGHRPTAIEFVPCGDDWEAPFQGPPISFCRDASKMTAGSRVWFDSRLCYLAKKLVVPLIAIPFTLVVPTT
jgi:hypothetical protein